MENREMRGKSVDFPWVHIYMGRGLEWEDQTLSDGGEQGCRSEMNMGAKMYIFKPLQRPCKIHLKKKSGVCDS
jgi:hypothetical protein